MWNVITAPQGFYLAYALPWVAGAEGSRTDSYAAPALGEARGCRGVERVVSGSHSLIGELVRRGWEGDPGWVSCDHDARQVTNTPMRASFAKPR